MNLVQLLKFALHGLWRQKVRSTLTLVGVTVGVCALAFSLALGLGLRAFIDTEFKQREDFWRVHVRVDEPVPDENAIPEKDRAKLEVKGEMSDERRARLREALLDRYAASRAPKPPKMLTPEVIGQIQAMPGVGEVRTFRTGEGRLWAATSETPAVAFAVDGPLEELRPRLIAGRLPSSPDAGEVVVSEFALYQLGLRDDADLEKALGLPVKLEVGGVRNSQSLALARALIGGRPPEDLTRGQLQVLDKIAAGLRQNLDLLALSAAEKAELQKMLEQPADPSEERPLESGKTATGAYRICGVVRVLTREERKKKTPLDSWELTAGHAFLPPAAGEELFGQLPWTRDGGFMTADVRVTPGADLPAVVKAIEDMGFRTYSGAKWFAAAKREVTLIAAGLNLFAMIALFVAGVGIMNTFITNVVERTREIGILRAVGATRGQIMSLFLLEGGMIGLLGSGLGLALAYGLALAADDWVRSLILDQMGDRPMLSTTIFVFPWWLWCAAALFALAVTTVAALYPARRAAAVDPIEALRYG